MHILKNKELWKWDECLFCKSCTPEALDITENSPACDRCMMGNEPDRFIPNFETKREKQLENALKVLCQLKEHKDRHGKTELYIHAQPSAWKEAKELIE